MPPFDGDNGVLLPIHVGKAISDLDLHMQADNEVNGQACDNISAKNESYCELTAMYWAWKNIRKIYPDVQYIGLFHHRRFMTFTENRWFRNYFARPINEISTYRINAEEVINIIDSGNIILPKKYIMPFSLQMQYALGHVSDDYNVLCEVIKEEFPDYYDDFIEVMERNNKVFFFNMFIMKYDDFVKYCEWLFSVLSVVEQRIHYQDYRTYQRHIFAFMAERLFNVYIHKNKLKSQNFHVCIYFKKDGEVKRRNFFLRFCRSIGFLIRNCVKELIFKLLSMKLPSGDYMFR